MWVVCTIMVAYATDIYISLAFAALVLSLLLTYLVTARYYNTQNIEPLDIFIGIFSSLCTCLSCTSLYIKYFTLWKLNWKYEILYTLLALMIK